MHAVGENQVRRRPGRRVIAALATVTLLLLSGSPNSAHASDTVVVLDTLGAASPATTFSVFGSGGTSVFAEQFIGPRFTLSEPMVITEVGAFMNNCRSIILGVPQCPETLPFIVEIRRSVNGVPDASGALGRFTLSHDDDPLVVSFETTNPSISLAPGEYFALIGSQGADAGFLLDGASSPFNYTAGMFTMGVLNPATGGSFATERPGAVRILAKASPAIPVCNGKPATIVGPAGDSTVIGTADDDVIVDLSGNNRIRARGGNDTICTGPGNEEISGGGGNDWVDAGDGRNSVEGNAGHDRLTTGSGNDQLEGNGGNDTLTGGAGADKFLGGDGTDTATDFRPTEGDTKTSVEVVL